MVLCAQRCGHAHVIPTGKLVAGGVPSPGAGMRPLPLLLAQGAKTLLVGFPGGKVCTEQHIPGYVAAVSSEGSKGWRLDCCKSL